VKGRDAAAAAIDTEVFAGVVPSPMQTQVQRMGGMSSAVIGGFCEHSPVVHELVIGTRHGRGGPAAIYEHKQTNQVQRPALKRGIRLTSR
jgi:hypothetical protein